MHPANLEADKDRVIAVLYTNYRRETRRYEIIPHNIFFGRTEFYPGPEQWFIKATDVSRNVVRDFAFAHVVKLT